MYHHASLGAAAPAYCVNWFVFMSQLLGSVGTTTHENWHTAHTSAIMWCLFVKRACDLRLSLSNSWPQHHSNLANSVLLKQSIKMPAWPHPLAHLFFPPLATNKPLLTPQDQTARFGPWLQLSIGSYGNGCLSPYLSNWLSDGIDPQIVH